MSVPHSFSISSLAMAVCLACAGATGALASLPVSADTTMGAAVPMQIPAGSLSDTLTRIAQLTGHAIAADPALLAGLQAPAVSGNLTAMEAAQTALAGSGLEAVPLSGKALTVRRSPQAVSLNPPAAPQTLQAVTVTTERLSSELMDPTYSYTVIDHKEYEELKAMSPNVMTMLTKAVPSLSDSSRNLTDFGQTLRGRNALILVDGVPMNTNRNASRHLASVDPNRIERIEVVRGSNAFFGSGASGGVIAITTRRPGGENIAETTVGGDISLSKPIAAGMSGNISHYFSGSGDVVDYELDLSYRHIGGSYDAKGRRVAPDASQGDLFDSNTYGMGGKLGFRIDANQYLQLSANHYRAKQRTDYASDPSVNRLPAGSAEARALRGLDLARQNEVEDTIASISYEHKDLLGSALSTQFYVRDNSTRFPPSDSRNNVNRGNNVDQVRQNNKVFGARLTVDTPLTASGDTSLRWGADFIQERSNMPLDVFDPNIYDQSSGLVFETVREQIYMPWTTTRSLGLFGQLQHRFNEQWSVEAGIRYERASASFDDFVPLSQSRVPNPATVAGGRINYDAFVYNAGLLYKPTQDHEFYTSFSQGFDLPDVGLQLRNARAGFDLGASDLQAVKTDNYELGWRGTFDNTLMTVAVFHSRSKLGAVQSLNNGLTLLRTSERIYGVEATIDHYSDDDAWAVGGTLSWMRGKEKASTASDSQDMSGYRIPPLKLTAYVQYRPTQRWVTRAQVMWFGSRDYRLADGRTQFGRADVKSYYALDLMARYDFDKKNWVTLGVQNALNKQYLPLYSQLLRSNNNGSRLPAAGAVLSATYTHRW